MLPQSPLEQTEYGLVATGKGWFVRNARVRSTGSDWGAHTVADSARRHNAGLAEETVDPEQAYARFERPKVVRYRNGLLPGSP